jgi:hypothetical protein
MILSDMNRLPPTVDLVDGYFRQPIRILRACGFNSNPASPDLYAAITWCMRYTN